MSNEDTRPELCFCLKVQCRDEQSEWLAAWLVARGFAAVEERPCEAGAELVVYDESRKHLEQTVKALVSQESSTTPTGRLLAPFKGFDPQQISIEQLDPNWRLAWTQYLQPVRLTDQWTVVPQSAPDNRIPGELYLEPALAFGFGEHPTTTLIAPWIENACVQHGSARVLDVGCGTGILSLLAAVSGAHSVLGVDTSADAVVAAALNARNNGLTELTDFRLGSTELVARQFDIICANIESGILIALASGISPRLAPAGKLALAGLLKEQEVDVVAAYRSQGIWLRPCSSATDQGGSEWLLLESVQEP